MNDIIQPKARMTSTGVGHLRANFVCPTCGKCETGLVYGDPEKYPRPWCSHGDHTVPGTHITEDEAVELSEGMPENMGYTRMEFAEVRIGKPHASPDEPWGQEVVE